MRNISRVICVVAALTAPLACNSIVDSSVRSRNVSVILTRIDAVSPAPKGPFVSVIDTVALVITSADGGQQTIRRQVLSTDTLVSLPVTVPEGSTRFQAAVLSRNGSILFDSSVTATVATDNFTVTIPLAARRPVMLVAPDALVMSPPPTNTIAAVPATAALVVHNRGRSTLSWTVQPDTSFASCKGCDVTPRQFPLPADGSVRVVISSYRPLGSTITLRFVSAEGILTVTARVQ